MTNLEFKLTLMSLGLSPKDAAELFGLQRSSVYDILYGRCPVSKPVTKKLTDFANKVNAEARNILKSDEYIPATYPLTEDNSFERAVSIKLVESFYERIN